MMSIDIDFDVFKALTARRRTEATTYNDVIRELLKLPGGNATVAASADIPNGGGWVQKATTFPNGTDFRATYKGKTYTAKVIDNRMMLDGQAMNSLSEAATAITKNSVNGWRFWEFRFPGATEWRSAESLKR